MEIYICIYTKKGDKWLTRGKLCRIMKAQYKGGEKMARKYKDIKFSFYISETMDNDLEMMADLMGLSKSEFVRNCVATQIFGFKKSIDLAREMVKGEYEQEKSNLEK